MKIAGAIFGFLILVAIFVLWFRAYRSIKGEDSQQFSKRNGKGKKEKHSIEEFIASYKRGEVAIGNGAPIAAKASPTAPAAPVAGRATPAAAKTPTIKRDAFVSGPTKLVYLACKTGLRDHHIFAHVPLSALSTGGAIDPALAVDVLICNAAMASVAAIDLIDAGNSPANAVKSEYLKALGIRYLRLSAQSLPRPDQLHALLYKM